MMNVKTLEVLIGALEEKIGSLQPGGAIHAALLAIEADARRELERMHASSISDDPITIMESEIKALGWESYTPSGIYADAFPFKVTYCSPDALLEVRFLLDGSVRVYLKKDLEYAEPAGVKTVDDLVDLTFRITGKRSG